MLMRRVLVFALVLFASLHPVLASAAQGQSVAGTISGSATDAGGKAIANVGVRLRNVVSGELFGSTTTTNAAGQFTFVGVTPGTYAVEVFNTTGVAGTSVSITLGNGSAVTGVSVVASLAGGASTGGSFFSSTVGIITVAAAGAAVAGVTVAAQGTESPSR
jgi:hypothetical protein